MTSVEDRRGKPAPDLLSAAGALEAFAGNRLTRRIAELERAFADSTGASVAGQLSGSAVTHDLLAAAYVLKRAAGQINVVIHALGILLCLPRILSDSERVESLSLGAGNTGRAFDLVTTERIAEFKFIHWQGGSEVIRQNALFKDLYQMAVSDSPKRKVMYVLDTTYPRRFLTGNRALSSVMSRNRRLWEEFRARYGDRYETVGQWYADNGSAVELVDVTSFLPELDTITALDGQ